MPTHNVTVAFDHELVYERKACRGQRNDHVRATMTVEIREVGEDEAPVSFRAELASHVSATPPHIQERTYRRLDGNLVATPRNWLGKPLTLEDLSPDRSHHARHISPWQGPEYPFRTFGGESFPEEVLRVRRVIRDDRAEMEALVRTAAETVAVTKEGHLLVPFSEPVWVVRGAENTDGSPPIAALMCGDRLSRMRLATFRADRGAAAVRYAERLGAATPPRVDGSIETLDGTAFRYDDMRREAGHAFAAILEPGLVGDFHLLPTTALVAWVGFRREAEAHAAGGRDALHAAFSHLSDLSSSLDRDSPVSDALLERISTPMFRYRELDLPDLGREPTMAPEDEEALGSLSAA